MGRGHVTLVMDGIMFLPRSLAPYVLDPSSFQRSENLNSAFPPKQEHGNHKTLDKERSSVCSTPCGLPCSKPELQNHMADVEPQGSKDPKNRALGPKYH